VQVVLKSFFHNLIPNKVDISVIKSKGVSNTGKADQYLNPDIFVGDYLVPRTWKVDHTEHASAEEVAANVLAAINTGLLNPNPEARIYFIGPYESLDDQSEAPTVQTLGHGKKVTTKRGLTYHTHTFDEGGFQYFHSVLTFRDRIRDFKIVRIDAKGNLVGTRVYSTPEGGLNGLQVTGFKGLTLSRLYPMDWKAANADTEALYGIEIGLKTPDEINEHIYVVETGQDMIAYAEERGIQQVELILHESTDNGLIKVAVTTALRKINLAEEVTDFQTNIAAYVVTNETTGAVVDIDSISWDPERKEVNVVADVTDPDYVVGNTGSIRLADVDDLATEDLKYYESNKVKFAFGAIVP